MRTVLAEEVDAPWDLVILACKAYDLDGAIASFANAVGPDTAILPLLNGMAHLEVLGRRFGPERVLGGLCSLAVTLKPDGTIVHLNDFHALAFGEQAGGESDRVRAIAALFDESAVRASGAILLEMWEKWVFLATLAGITCVMRASVGDILAAAGEGAVTALLAETGAVATAAGHPPRPAVMGKYRALLLAPGSTLTASMLRDIERGGPTEADHVLGDLLARGRGAGLDLPLLALASLHLGAAAARWKRERGLIAARGGHDVF